MKWERKANSNHPSYTAEDYRVIQYRPTGPWYAYWGQEMLSDDGYITFRFLKEAKALCLRHKAQQAGAPAVIEDFSQRSNGKCHICGDECTTPDAIKCSSCWEVMYRLPEFLKAKIGRRRVRELLAEYGDE